MFTRLFLCTTSRNLYKIPKHILVTQQHAALPKYIAHTRCLHVKVYDKDAGLETKRAANEIQQSNDEPHINRKAQTHRRKQNFANESSTLKKSLLDKKPTSSFEFEQPKTSEISNETKGDPDLFGNAASETVVEDEGKTDILKICVNKR